MSFPNGSQKLAKISLVLLTATLLSVPLTAQTANRTPSSSSSSGDGVNSAKNAQDIEIACDTLDYGAKDTGIEKDNKLLACLKKALTKAQKMRDSIQKDIDAYQKPKDPSDVAIDKPADFDNDCIKRCAPSSLGGECSDNFFIHDMDMPSGIVNAAGKIDETAFDTWVQAQYSNTSEKRTLCYAVSQRASNSLDAGDCQDAVKECKFNARTAAVKQLQTQLADYDGDDGAIAQLNDEISQVNDRVSSGTCATCGSSYTQSSPTKAEDVAMIASAFTPIIGMGLGTYQYESGLNKYYGAYNNYATQSLQSCSTIGIPCNIAAPNPGAAGVGSIAGGAYGMMMSGLSGVYGMMGASPYGVGAGVGVGLGVPFGVSGIAPYGAAYGTPYAGVGVGLGVATGAYGVPYASSGIYGVAGGAYGVPYSGVGVGIAGGAYGVPYASSGIYGVAGGAYGVPYAGVGVGIAGGAYGVPYASSGIYGVAGGAYGVPYAGVGVGIAGGAYGVPYAATYGSNYGIAGGVGVYGVPYASSGVYGVAGGVTGGVYGVPYASSGVYGVAGGVYGVPYASSGVYGVAGGVAGGVYGVPYASSGVYGTAGGVYGVPYASSGVYGVAGGVAGGVYGVPYASSGVYGTAGGVYGVAGGVYSTAGGIYGTGVSPYGAAGYSPYAGASPYGQYGALMGASMYQGQLQGATAAQGQQDYMLAQQASYAAQLRVSQTAQQLGMYSGGYNPYTYSGMGAGVGIGGSMFGSLVF